MNKLDNIIAISGAFVLFVGLILQFVKFEYAPYIYIVGALMFGWIQAKTGRYFGKNIVLRRLKRQQLITSAIDRGYAACYSRCDDDCLASQ